MGTNIENKARIHNIARQHELAAGIADRPPQVLEQTDTFFCVPHGRLKLREFADGKGELIHYQRADEIGPKPSSYRIIPIANPQAHREVLSAALGVRGVVRKHRTVYMIGQTRVHLDQVAGLGTFVELEVVLSPGQSLDEAKGIANKIMHQLEIDEQDLIEEAYVDLLGRCRHLDDPT